MIVGHNFVPRFQLVPLFAGQAVHECLGIDSERIGQQVSDQSVWSSSEFFPRS